MTWRARAAALICALMAPAVAQAQAPRASIETVAAGDYISSDDRPSAVFDVTGLVDAGHGLLAIVRPWIWLQPDGTWTWQWYQLQVRYVTPTRRPVRIDAGVITSPIGLATQELRADLNPTIAVPFYYYTPLPQIGSRFQYLTPMSSSYPLGVVAATSGAHWDARAGVTDTSPVAPREEFKRDQPARSRQFVGGGGVTPMPGLRIGFGVARGAYAHQPALTATVLNLEFEFTVAHTRLSGELVRDSLQTESGASRIHAFYLEGTQTLTPRLFAAGRYTGVRSAIPSYESASLFQPAAEAIAGYRLNPDVTVRGGYYGARVGSPWDNRVELSVVFARRWF